MRVVDRRWIGVSAGVLPLAALAMPALGQTNPIPQGSLTVKLQPAVTIPSAAGAPQDLVTANDGTGRLFVATRGGQIRTINAGGSLDATPFLNLSSAGVSLFTGGEGGFPGIAFSPTFSAPASTPGSGKFYTFTTETFATTGPAADYSHPELFPTTAVNPSNQIVVREWSAAAGAATANTTSRVLLRLNHPQNNHQGGGLKFGPDGNLYVALGDGGGGDDFSGSANSTTDGHTNATGNAQDTTVAFGKILRIDPKGTNANNGQYGIPAGNPFATSAGTAGTALREIFAYGLRNPYRIGFDRQTGSLYAGDVGQGQREEVDVVTTGGNYGWVYREGTRDNSGSNGSGRTPPGGFTSIAPIGEYTHGDGNSVIGGFVYRGSDVPSLFGKYVFGDFLGTGANGRLFYMDAAGGAVSEFKFDLTGGAISPAGGLYGFGEDARGELYAYFANGTVAKLVPEPTAAGLTAAAMAVVGLTARRRHRRRPAGDCPR